MAIRVTNQELKGFISEVVKGVMDRQRDAMDTDRESARENALSEFTKAINSLSESKKPTKDKFGAVVRCFLGAGRDPEKAKKAADKIYGENSDVSKALTSSLADSGGLLISGEFASEVIEMLRPEAVVRTLQPTFMTLNASTLDQPALASGAQSEYVGETEDKAASQPTFRDMRLQAKKLRTMVPISNDLIRFGQTSPGAEGIVQQDMIQSMATTEDQKFIRSIGTERTPRGLRYLAHEDNVFDANSTVNLANVTFDLGKAVQKLLDWDVRMTRPGWIFAPRTYMYLATVRDSNGNYAFRNELLQGNLWGFPYRVTTQIPTNLGAGDDESEVYFADFRDVVIGDGSQVEIRVSDEAAYINSDGTLVSAFGQDVTVVRAISHHDINLRHRESVAIIDAVEWEPSGS